VKAFIKIVVERQDSIISFNWDLLLEICCKDLSLCVSYYNSPSNGLHISKPHGSLNLAEISRARYDAMKNSMNIHNIFIDWENGEKIVLRASDPCDAANRIISPTGATLLVEPNARKSYTSPWIQLQWQRALNMTKEAEEICVIGYSLPETDFRPRILFQLAGVNANPDKRILLIGPNANNVAGRYRKYINLPIDPIEKPWFEWLTTQA